ncbi:hypothetical protein GCM10009611_10060 [Arthrobacter roseus]
MPLATHHRLLLALKSALAGALAWWVALLMPGVAAEFPYYAPIGAMAAMYTTVGGSIKQGMETLVGLGFGILVAFLVTQVAAPNMWTVALVVGIGVLVAGLPRMGAGKDLIPTAALIVMLLGDQDPNGFSLGYFIQMLVGVAVGLLVNSTLFPPLHLNGAVNGLAELRSTLSLQLDDMSAAILESWPPEHQEWSKRGDGLSQLSRKVHDAVALAEVSQKGNFRRKINRRDVNADVDLLKALERTTFHVQDVTEILASAIWDSPDETPVSQSTADPLSNAFAACSTAISEWDPESESYRVAEDAVHELQRALNTTARKDEAIQTTASLAVSLRRMLWAIRT